MVEEKTRVDRIVDFADGVVIPIGLVSGGVFGVFKLIKYYRNRKKEKSES